MTTPRLTEQEIDTLRALCEKATPAPWRYDANEMLILPVGRNGWCGEAAGGNDGRLMAAARTALPRLLAERDAMAKELEEARNLLTRADSGFIRLPWPTPSVEWMYLQRDVSAYLARQAEAKQEGSK